MTSKGLMCLWRCAVVAIVLVSLIAVLIPVPRVKADSVVTFPDANLEAAIRNAFYPPLSGDIYESDLLGLTEFRASDRLIRNLAGLEHCTNLEQLILNGNQITDLSPLAGLTRLFRLWLWNNQIGNLSPLTGLTSLRSLSLAGNYVSDLSPLAGLTSLWKLYLDYNEIGNLEPLVSNPGIGSGDEIYLEGNPLNSVSVNTYIPQLEAEGAIVYWDTTNHPPARPTNLLPANAATGVSLTPTLQSSAFSDPDSGDTLAASQWQMRTSTGSYSSAVYGGTGTTTSISVPPGYLTYSTAYYWHVRYQDNRGDWSSWSSETSFTTIPDPTPPTTPVVSDDGVNTTSTSYLHGSWTSSDPETGITEYQYAIGSSSGATDVVGWTSVGTSTEVTRTGLNLTVGVTYYFAVKARNGGGLWSAVGVSDGIVVANPPDTTPPTTPVVVDEGVSTISTTQLYASWTSSDPETGIAEYQYAIGTTAGGTNVVGWTSVGVNTEVTKTGLSLTVGTTYYFAVKARNGEGLWSEVGVSNGITVVTPPDATPPTTPVVTDDDDTTTITSQLHASWNSSDPESGIVEYQYAIGTAAGASDVVGWTSTGTSTQVTKTGLSLTVGVTYYFAVISRNGEGLWSEVGVSDGITVVPPPDTTPPTTPIVADDGTATDNTSQLHASWNSSDPESGIAEYQYAIGTSSGGTNVVGWTSVGTDTEVTKTALSLTVGSIYYFAVKARNGEGLWSEVGVSDGIIVVEPTDTTPPATPVVTDEGDTTDNISQLHASWTSSDPESGIVEYRYAIGTSAGGADVVGWTSVDTSGEVTKTGLSLTVGNTYYFAVKAQNGAGLWSEVGVSDGILVESPTDTTPPTTPVVTDDGASTTSTSQLHASWTSSDPESGIAEYQYAIGTSVGGADVIGWTSAGMSTQITKTGLSLSVGTVYYFAVKGRNGADQWSEIGLSDGIAVVALPDTTPPTTPVVTDDGAITTSTTELYASWTSSDSQSGIAECQYAIGTIAGASDVIAWTSVGTGIQVTKTGLNLTVGTTYYFAVRARNGAGLWSAVGVSNGITVVTPPDSSPPTTPVVTDDGASTTSTGYLHGSWISSDPESGVAEYQYAIGVSSGGTEVVNWTSVGTSTQVTKTGLILSVGTTYYFAVKARNGDGLWSAVGVSDGIVVVTPPDTTPPTTPVVTDEGSTTISTTQLQASWSCSDPETGIAEYQYAIGVSSGGTEVVNWTSVGTSTQVTKSGLSLSVGATYYFAVKARNGEGLWSQVGVSNGITVLAPENHAPAQPANLLPVPGATGMSPTPTLQSSAFSDPDAGDPHAASQWQIRTSTGSYDVPAYESTSQSSLVSISVSPGSLTYSTTYYWHVRHQDSRGAWSGWSIETFFTTVPDLTPPTTPVVTDDGATTASSSELRASWSCSDLESGIAEYQYAIGTASGANNVVDWTSAGKSTQATETGLSLNVGTTYYFAVKARNGSGVWSEVGVSDGIKAVAVTDTTPPSTPVVKDDGATTTKASQIHATWTSSDPESGIAEYQYAIGTLAGGTDVVGWSSVGTNTQVIKMSLNLSVGTTYYFAVKARNHAGLWSEVGFSDGIAVVASADTTPPTIPVVTDDGASTTSVSQLYASWTSSDPESGIAEYQYAIGTSPGATDVIGWTAVGKSTEVTSAGLSLTLGTTYYFGVKAQNGAGIWSEVGVSDGIMVVDEDGGGGEVGGCCASSDVDASASDLAMVWGTLGLCCGTGLLVARRVGKRDRR